MLNNVFNEFFQQFFFRRIFLTNFFRRIIWRNFWRIFLTNYLTIFDFSDDFFWTFNLLFIASFRIAMFNTRFSIQDLYRYVKPIAPTWTNWSYSIGLAGKPTVSSASSKALVPSSVWVRCLFVVCLHVAHWFLQDHSTKPKIRNKDHNYG